MRVNIGTLELGPDELRAIRLELTGGGGRATRTEVKAWAQRILAREREVVVEKMYAGRSGRRRRGR